jgi:hypothetical protein
MLGTSTNPKEENVRIPAITTMVAVAAVAIALVPPATGAPKTLYATVGPEDTISFKTAGGAAVKSVTAGAYTIVVRDRSSDHNFHLRGTGVNKTTSVGGTGTFTWRNVKLAKGKVYRFVCDPHADDMSGSFRVR